MMAHMTNNKLHVATVGATRHRCSLLTNLTPLFPGVYGLDDTRHDILLSSRKSGSKTNAPFPLPSNALPVLEEEQLVLFTNVVIPKLPMIDSETQHSKASIIPSYLATPIS
jgi:hypothetical protein